MSQSSLALAGLGLLGAAREEPVAAAEPAPKSLRILILGGTGFLGPACTESALARGHKVTHFNSGRTEALRQEAGRPSVVPPGVEQLYGNRDPNKTADDRRNQGKAGAAADPNSPKGLSQLAGKKWDAVIDTSAYFPRMVRASAELLAPNVKQYLFISTISAYKSMATPNFDESAPAATLPTPDTEDFGKNYENYGGGKAECEKAAEGAMPGRVTNIRPGFIVGPRDTSGRFIYWPVRTAQGGEMAVPGAPGDPIQIIDVRDLADWIIHCLEGGITGLFNATGPAKEMSMKTMLEGISAGAGAKVQLTWIENAFLEQQGVKEGQFPLYEAPVGESAGAHKCNITKALAKGLRFRPVAETAKATLEWYRSLPPETQSRLAPQFASKPGTISWLETEKGLLAGWRIRKEK